MINKAKMVDQAILFATDCHANQTRKATNTPYILHPLEAGTIAASLTTKDGQVDHEVICAAILHDVIEDTDTNLQSIEDMFNKEVSKLVDIQSEDKSKSWQERKEHTINMLNDNKIKNVEIVILADKLSNMRSIRRDYNEIGEDLWNRFNVTDKEKHKWYYESIAKSMKQITHTPEFKEYKQIIQEVFYK